MVLIGDQSFLSCSLIFSEDTFLRLVCSKSPVLQFYNQQHFLFQKRTVEKQDKGWSGRTAGKQVQAEIRAEQLPQGLQDTVKYAEANSQEWGKKSFKVGSFHSGAPNADFLGKPQVRVPSSNHLAPARGGKRESCLGLTLRMRRGWPGAARLGGRCTAVCPQCATWYCRGL